MYLLPCLYVYPTDKEGAILIFLMIIRGNHVKEKFLSMYSYRIGAWSQCQYGKKTIDMHPFKTASTPQVYGHAQWCFRKSNSGEDIDMSYCS